MQYLSTFSYKKLKVIKGNTMLKQFGDKSCSSLPQPLHSHPYFSLPLLFIHCELYKRNMILDPIMWELKHTHTHTHTRLKIVMQIHVYSNAYNMLFTLFASDKFFYFSESWSTRILLTFMECLILIGMAQMVMDNIQLLRKSLVLHWNFSLNSVMIPYRI